jgi:surface antigen
MSIKTAATGLVLASALTLGACSPQYVGPNQSVGIVSGALIGGLAGNVIGYGDPGSTIAGAMIGGVLGGMVGADMDARDRERAYLAQYEAFDTGRPRRWRGDDAYGEVIPGPTYRSRGEFCREYTHTIYIGGRPREGYGTACREPDGSWRIVS